jgi:DNA modification methylase
MTVYVCHEQDPIGLMRFFVSHFSGEGSTVMDLMAGTGTFACAAMMEGRNAVAVETLAGFPTLKKVIVLSVFNLWFV